MTDLFVDIFKNFPPEIATLIMAALPIGELRMAIPVAYKFFGLSIYSSFFWSIVGNIMPVFFILKYFNKVSGYLIKKSSLFHKFFKWLSAHTCNRFNHHYDKYGMFALFLFTAIPFPMTGAWTASLGACLFCLPKRKSLLYISIGVLTAGIVVSLLSLGFFKIF